MAAMEDPKKRKLERTGTGDGVLARQSDEQLRLLLDPLRKDQLVDLLVKLGTQIPEVAEEIRGVASADPVHRKLFVRGLSWETTSETLFSAFSTHGDIEEGAVITDKATGKSRGYGFITYRHMESAQRALQEPSKLIDGRLAVCNLACEGLSSGSVSTDLALRKIYIGGLSPEISSETLLKFFGRHGEIEEGSVAYDKETTKSKGFGFVTYKTVEAAKKALDDPNKSLGGRNITVKLADSHKSKVIQTQAPMSMAPLALPYQHGFAQQGKSHAVSPDPVGYASYTHGLPSYPTAYGNAPSGFANQPQTSYMGLKKDQPGLPSTTTGVTGYSFYAAKP
ncbi:heterogeneous nuclear ribonucleoprotein A1/A3 protein [Dioscorea alata]|uniref:Heterogeneous nuclear ribonucleoprotein A1/A3 protein n=2 Tax=Dioscorea alata TaxID=55571 RepID=A0ACB7UJF6_DIOAL|nr:heterogeneous nuclear ribonucleoprotein A1/A3 protein [Dioscorea alata]KAH7660347.1 heterogeneous nuclear ribonucleoprotein A1/A3 protein [Dioscorea alata]